MGGDVLMKQLAGFGFGLEVGSRVFVVDALSVLTIWVLANMPLFFTKLKLS
jgi:hypothetical protein